MTHNAKKSENGKKNESTDKAVDVPPRAAELSDEVLESVKSRQQAAIEAVRKFVDTVDVALPEAVHPLRKTIVDGALVLADQLVTTQREFLRSIVRSADRPLSRPRDSKD